MSVKSSRPKRGSVKITDARPELAAEWSSKNEKSIDAYSAGSNIKAEWFCSLGHEYPASIGHRVRGSNCPYCTNIKFLQGFNDLKTLYPDVAAEWHPTLNGDLLPEMVMGSPGKFAHWLCEHGHEWRALMSNRVKSGHQCPYCSGKKVIVGETDLLARNPQLAAEWHPSLNRELRPQDFSFGSSHSAWWKCRRGHEWQAIIGSRNSGKGCRTCAGHVFEAGTNDLASLNPVLAAQWHPTLNKGVLPSSVRVTSTVDVWWQCDKDISHYWSISPVKRANGNGCSVCDGRTVIPGVNDFAALMPEAAKEWHPTRNDDLFPTQVSLNSGKRVWWQCNEGHEWDIEVYMRARGSDCPECRGGYNSSQGEKEVAEFVQSLGFEVLVNTRKFLSNGTELDVYIPEENFAIEFNGVYWHSEKFKDKQYHLRKVQACADAGITLYQVWEDDWLSKQDVVKSGIAHKLGATSLMGELHPDQPSFWFERIGARQTRVEELTYIQSREFLDDHHIQGGVSGSLYLGLVDKEDRLRAVSVMKKDGTRYLLERYATAGVVAGGFTKLLASAQKRLAATTIATFSDMQVSDGGLYEKNGFVVDKVLPPDYSYLSGSRRVHKFNFRKNRFKSDPDLLFAEGLTERELAELNLLPRIWDSGKLRWVKHY